MPFNYPTSTHVTTRSFNGWAVTAVDSLDTMHIMGLEQEYKRAMTAVYNASFSLPTVSDAL
jgi:hypothetical protein